MAQPAPGEAYARSIRIQYERRDSEASNPGIKKFLSTNPRSKWEKENELPLTTFNVSDFKFFQYWDKRPLVAAIKEKDARARVRRQKAAALKRDISSLETHGWERLHKEASARDLQDLGSTTDLARRIAEDDRDRQEEEEAAAAAAAAARAQRGRPQSAPPGGRPTSAGSSRAGGRPAAVQRPQSAPPGRKSNKRTCKACMYTWLDKYGKPNCPKCLSKMDDGYRFEDTELGKQMKVALVKVRKQQRDEEAAQRAVLEEAIWRGIERSKAEWEEFRAGLRALLGEQEQALTRRTCGTCGYSWGDKYGKPSCPKCFAPMNDGVTEGDTEVARSMDAAIEEMREKLREVERQQWQIIEEAKARGIAKSLKEWEYFREGLRALFAKDDTKITRRTCGTCGHSWGDKYGKPSCPKCFAPMNDGIGSGKKKPSRPQSAAF